MPAVVPDLEWQQELLYQRFATWEPKHTVPTVKELERQLWQERISGGLNAWASRYLEERLSKPSFFATFAVDHWTPPPGEEGTP